MIEKFEIQGVHANVNEKLKTYTTKKIGGLDRYISKHSRESAKVEVYLKELNSKIKNRSVCEVAVHLPQQTIVVKEAAINMYAAIDIVEAKLKKQLQKYKDMHGNGKTHRHIFARFSRRQRPQLSEEI